MKEGRQNVRFVLAILCLVLLFGLNVTRDGIELRYVTKLRTRVHVSNVIRDDNDISMMTRLETYESVLLEF